MTITADTPLILVLRPIESIIAGDSSAKTKSSCVVEKTLSHGSGIVVAELKRVASHDQHMLVEGTLRSTQIDAAKQQAGSEASAEYGGSQQSPVTIQTFLDDLYELSVLCEELQPGQLYSRCANKKVFHLEKLFWATTEKVVIQNVKRVADLRIAKAIRLADKLNIPILYAKDRNFTASHQ